MSAALRPEEVAALIAELAPRLAGARLEKVFDRPPHAFVLRFRTSAGKRWLLVTTRAGVSRLHFVDDPGELSGTPSAEAAELRALLGGGRVDAIDQPGGDRIMRIRFARGPKERSTRTDLVLELFGRSGRLLVIDDTSRRVRFRHGRAGIARGEPYRFPDPPERPPSSETWPIPFEPRSHVPEEHRSHDTPFHRFVELRMREEEARRDRVTRRQDREARLRREERRRRQLADKLEREKVEAERWERWQQWGELLKGSLSELRRGRDSVLVTDWFAPDTPQIEIPLDPVITPLENVERCFRRARKAKRALGPLGERLAVLTSELAEVSALMDELERTPLAEIVHEEEVLTRIESWLASGERRRHEQRGEKKQSQKEKVARGPRRYRSREGLEILAGRSARENDRLTIHLARGNDLFFHRADRPGAHVILRVARGRTAAPESIDDAAFLAAYLSGWRGPDNARVLWTEAKHVRKPKGLPPGKVVAQLTREHDVEYQEGRIATLATPDPPGEGGP